MGQGGKQQRPSSQDHRNLINEQQQIENALEQQKHLPSLEEGQELDSVQAAQLQPNMGNQSVQDLLNRLRNVNNELTQLDEEGQDLEEEQQEEVDLEEDIKSSFGGGSPEGGSATANPWETEFFYGGDDDEEGQKHRKRRRRRKHIDYLPLDEDPEEDTPPPPKDSFVDDLLPSPEQGNRQGDAIYKSVEVSLQHPSLIFGQSLDPQDLLKRKGALDPIRTPIEMGRFLSAHAQDSLSQSIAEIVGAPAAPLLSPQGGSSTAIARLATLAICSEVAEGGGTQTDNAVALSLHKSVWTRAVQAAKQLAQQGQLHAPKICSTVLGDNREANLMQLPTPHPLGGIALSQTLPFPMPVPKPYLAIPPEEAEETDELVALLDRALSQAITGHAPEDLKKHTIDYEILQPALKSANTLLGALGRSQVEFAAAAIAIKNIQPHSPTTQTLKYADNALRKLAQATVTAGRQIEGLYGANIPDGENQAQQPIKLISETIFALISLRKWCFSTIAGALNHADVSETATHAS